jgi:hypothetical protein
LESVMAHQQANPKTDFELAHQSEAFEFVDPESGGNA